MLKFNVNPEKKIVVAYFQNEDGKYLLDCLANDIVVFIYSLFSSLKRYSHKSLAIATNNTIRFRLVDKFMRKYAYDERSVMGIAKCSGSDEFNEEAGMSIASEKLKKKEREIFRKFKKFLYQEAIRGLDSFKARLGNFEDE